MVVDEFGREIPAPTGDGAASDPASSTSPQHHQQQQQHSSSSSSYHHRRHDSPSQYHSSSRYRPYSSPSSFVKYSSGGGSGRISSTSTSIRGGSGGALHPRHHHHSPRGAATTTTTSGTSSGHHISFQYTSEPLLCQFVWKDKQKEQQQEKDSKDDDNKKDDADNKQDNENEKTSSPQEEITNPTEEEQVADKQQQQQQQDDEEEEQQQQAATTTLENNPPEDESSSSAEYDAYRRKYCLNMIRAFFNQHLDDTWFRAEYSPACRQAWLKQEQERSCEEAKAILEQIMIGMNQKEMTKDDDPSSENLMAAATTTEAAAATPLVTTHPFIEQARLGGGQKTASPSLSSIPTSHLFSWQQQQLPDDSSSSSNNNNNNTTAALLVSEIPPSVTDDQIIFGLLQQCSSSSSSSALTITKDMERAVRVHGMTANHGIPTTGRSVLQRQAVVLAPRVIVDNIWQTLSSTSGSSSSSSSPRQTSIPRRKDDYYNASQQQQQQAPPQQWQIQVDCTDPYGRAQYDANGKGQAPADGLAVPPQKARLLVGKLLYSSSITSTTTSSSTPVAVLSAAMSTTQRIKTDCQIAQDMACHLDTARHIPTDVNWNAVYQVLFGSGGSTAGESADDNNNNKDADILDVCIAYLRRVHLVSFYQSAEQPAAGLAQVVTGKHAASMIRFRLEQADDILAEATPAAVPTNAATTTTTTEEESKTTQPVDLLVQRLDASLEKAHTDFAEWASGNSDRNYLGLTTEQLAQAAEIQQAEASVRDTWLRDHTTIDNDQRARCSFHFCHKLFKDTTFLHKHLLKKHAEYLVAEQAKCHDSYMMKAWDAATERPVVPDILVDCGSRFGLVAAPVTGQVPDCVDPEPELWRRDEERRKEEMRMRREEVRQQHHHQQYQHRDMGSTTSGEPHAPRPSNFVDVDDMKVEKVELSFENVEVPPVVNKKKKKKRKLL